MLDQELFERLVVALERIADAMESNKTPPETVTPFPWDEISKTTRERIHKGMHTNQRFKHSRGYFEKYSWPLSCEDLCALGPHAILDLHHVGEKAVNEIREKLDSLGFRF